MAGSGCTISTARTACTPSVLVAGGDESVDALLTNGEAVHYPSEAYRHAKTVAAIGAGVRLLERAPIPGARLSNHGQGLVSDTGRVTLVGSSAPSADELSEFAASFGDAIAAPPLRPRDSRCGTRLTTTRRGATDAGEHAGGTPDSPYPG